MEEVHQPLITLTSTGLSFGRRGMMMVMMMKRREEEQERMLIVFSSGPPLEEAKGI